MEENSYVISGNWEWYNRYDVYVNKETGEIALKEMCTCKPEDNCYYMNNWIEDGCPTILPQNHLDEWREMLNNIEPRPDDWDDEDQFKDL